MLNGILTVTNLVSNFGAACKSGSFFGLKPWWAYLNNKTVNGQCEIDFVLLPKDGRSDILLVLLVIIDDLLRVAGLIAIGFIIWAGVLYITSQGSPDVTQKAQMTIQNALLGLVICVMAIALVSFIATRIG